MNVNFLAVLLTLERDVNRFHAEELIESTSWNIRSGRWKRWGGFL